MAVTLYRKMRILGPMIAISLAIRRRSIGGVSFVFVHIRCQSIRAPG